MQAYEEVILPLSFIRRISQMRQGQTTDPDGIHTKELEELVDKDLKAIAEIIHEKRRPAPKEQLPLPL